MNAWPLLASEQRQRPDLATINTQGEQVMFDPLHVFEETVRYTLFFSYSVIHKCD